MDCLIYPVWHCLIVSLGTFGGEYLSLQYKIYAALLRTQGKQCSFGISTPLRHFMWIATCPQLWDYVTVVHRQQEASNSVWLILVLLLISFISNLFTLRIVKQSQRFVTSQFRLHFSQIFNVKTSN
jgi:hypothetical protein